MMWGKKRISSSFSLHTLLLAQGVGADLRTIMRGVGLSQKEIADIHHLSLASHARVLNAVFGVTKNPRLFVEVGENLLPGGLGVVGHLLQTAPNVGTALQCLEKCWFHLEDGASLKLRTENGEARLEYSSDHDREEMQWFYLMLLSFLGGVVQKLAYKPVDALKAGMFSGLGEEARKVLDSWVVPVSLEENVLYVAWPEEVLELPIPHADATLHQIFLKEAERGKVVQIPGELTSSSVTAVIKNAEDIRGMSLEDAAAALDTSVRDLQRKLSKEDTSFRKVKEKVLLEVSCSLLEMRSGSIEEVASALGYSDRRAFERAFKRWTGKTPFEYRKSGAGKW